VFDDPVDAAEDDSEVVLGLRRRGCLFLTTATPRLGPSIIAANRGRVGLLGRGRSIPVPPALLLAIDLVQLEACRELVAGCLLPLVSVRFADWDTPSHVLALGARSANCLVTGRRLLTRAAGRTSGIARDEFDESVLPLLGREMAAQEVHRGHEPLGLVEVPVKRRM